MFAALKSQYGQIFSSIQKKNYYNFDLNNIANSEKKCRENIAW